MTTPAPAANASDKPSRNPKQRTAICPGCDATIDAGQPCPACNIDASAKQKNVVITFHDGEVTTERKVDEVNDREETLFLRRYGQPGTEFDKCDIKNFEVLMSEDDAFDA